MKSIVKQIGEINSWEGQHGVMYSAFITLEDGTSGLVNAKTEDNLKGWINQEVEYTLESRTSSNGKEYNKMKLSKPQVNNYSNPSKGGGSYKDEWAINRRTALMQAVIVDAKNWKQVACEMYEWLELQPEVKADKPPMPTEQEPIGGGKLPSY